MVVAVCALLIGCAPASSSDTYDAGNSVVGQLVRQASESGSRVRWYADVLELLDTTHFVINGVPAGPITDAVVVGNVTHVVPGLGFWMPGGDAPGGTPTTFDDPRSLWRTVHVHVTVDEVLSGDTGERGQIVVGFAFPGTADFDRIRDDFLSMPAVVLFLLRDSPVFDYDDTLYAVLRTAPCSAR